MERTLKESITNNVNASLKDFQSTLLKCVNGMIAKKLEIININMVKTIQEVMIQIQTSHMITTHNKISQEMTPLKYA